ncbi:hypothetical protein GJ36_07140 [Pasteurella multocida]|nr:hypothetical protein CLD34_03085 [Pasteurella multocida]EPE75761.1 hypothetical protein I010_04595 [Pasteurella multocida 1500C]ERL41353.1 hypothetical protein B654_06031 [Pasteurella multocida subsp. multocida str. PMTB]KEP94216.1 hypothetical protein UQU_0201475 [Pasteurella multocida subsp. multocida VTCCBAA264]KLT47346.1 hypothetical protein PVACC_07745 [Pasteurella multocida subsp. multocida]
MTALTLALVFSRVLFHFLKLKHPSQMSTVFRLQTSAAVKKTISLSIVKKRVNIIMIIYAVKKDLSLIDI